MEVQMKQAIRPGPARAASRAAGGTAARAAASGSTPLGPAAQRMNAGPHAASLSALQAVVAQRACADCEHVRRAMGGAEPVQRAAKSPGGLPDGLRAGLENLSGRDLSGVSVHYDSPRPAQLNAHAFAQGSEIHVAPGQEKHLPHEGWHAVQQMQNRVRPTLDLGGTPVNDSAQLEREADVMGARALAAGKAAQLRARQAAAPAGPVQRVRIEVEPDGAVRLRGGAAFAPPAQLVGLQYAGAGANLYREIVAELQKDPNVAYLIQCVLTGGDLTICTDKDDDTRYEREGRSIRIASGKSKNEVRAAILFELNNAANPHAYTDAAEKALLGIGNSGGSPGSADYLHVAREMEKDEFVSLVNYAHQAEGLALQGPARNVLREKYDAMRQENGSLSYDAYLSQNRRTGHTLELAESTHKAFTGGYKVFSGVPLEFGEPHTYEAYQTGGGSVRVRERVRRQLEQEQGVYRVDARLANAAPAFVPSSITPTYHLSASSSSSSSSNNNNAFASSSSDNNNVFATSSSSGKNSGDLNRMITEEGAEEHHVPTLARQALELIALVPAQSLQDAVTHVSHAVELILSSVPEMELYNQDVALNTAYAYAEKHELGSGDTEKLALGVLNTISERPEYSDDEMDEEYTSNSNSNNNNVFATSSNSNNNNKAMAKK